MDNGLFCIVVVLHFYTIEVFLFNQEIKYICLYQVPIILYHARQILPLHKPQNIPQKQRLPQTQTRIQNQQPATNLPNKTKQIHPMQMCQITTPDITRAQKDTDK